MRRGCIKGAPIMMPAPAVQRRSTVAIPHGVGRIYGELSKALKPKPITSLSDWADRNRILVSTASAEAGMWRTSRTPYLREIQDCLSASSPVQRVVLRFAAQLGKTEVGLNWIGYVVEHAPAPMFIALPTLDVCDSWGVQRLDPMLASTPSITHIFDVKSRRTAGNSARIKVFPGGGLFMGGANSPSSLASKPIQYILCDEIDRFPWEVGKEGDPLGLLEERQNTFPRRKILLLSTPTTSGLSRIDDEYQASDQRQYHVPCPECGERQPLRWRDDNGDYSLVRNAATGRVSYRCAHCSELIEEHHKTAMLRDGIWIPGERGRTTRGYALNQLYSPIGLGRTWSELLTRWESARGDTSKLKRFINTSLGEPWEESGDSLDPLCIMARLEIYPDSLPVGVRTAGVDVHKDRLECTVVDFGAGEEAWLHDHLIIPGDTAQPEVWSALDDEFRALKPAAVAIDSGYNATHVYEFVSARRWCYAVKGMPGPHRPIVEDKKARSKRLRHRRKIGVHVHLVGVDSAKAQIYACLKRTDPGPGYIHFPNHPAFDDEYFAQLAAEKLITKVRGTRAYAEWVQTRARNEALDCLVYALAALRLSDKDPTPKPVGQRQARPLTAPAPSAMSMPDDPWLQ